MLRNDIKTITEALATLILQGNIPLEAVAIAGKTIALDARVCSYDLGATKRASLRSRPKDDDGDRPPATRGRPDHRSLRVLSARTLEEALGPLP
jgi:hypothetical protein